MVFSNIHEISTLKETNEISAKAYLVRGRVAILNLDCFSYSCAFIAVAQTQGRILLEIWLELGHFSTS